MTSTRFTEIRQIARPVRRGIWTNDQLSERIAELQTALSELVEFTALRGVDRECLPDVQVGLFDVLEVE